MALDPIWRRRPVNEKRFDTIARGLARIASRRRVVGGVLGGTLTLLTGPTGIANRGKLRRAHRGGQGQAETDTATDVLPEGVLAGGVWEETLQMCHYDPETGGYHIVPVSTVAVPEQLARGDTLYIDCCVSTDCFSTDCLTAKGCVSGACAYEPALNAPCKLENGAYGICRSDAVCVPTSAGEQVAEVAVG
jgi:hypothetical protein